jgi:hypothetical protein
LPAVNLADQQLFLVLTKPGYLPGLPPEPTLTTPPGPGPFLATGNEQFTASGTNLDRVTAAKIGGLPVTNLSISGSTLTGTTPASDRTNSSLQLYTVFGRTSATNDFPFVPIVTSLAPTEGPSSGGNTVMLTGAGLLDVTYVQFGNTLLSNASAINATQLSVTAPPGYQTVQVYALRRAGPNDFVPGPGVPYTYIGDPPPGPVEGGGGGGIIIGG